MKTNKEIIIEIIEDLESKKLIKWPISSKAKITKDKLIECWTITKDKEEFKFYGYKSYHALSIAYKNIFNGIIKENCCSWRTHILNMYNYKYCKTCGHIKNVKKFNKSSTIFKIYYECMSCKVKKQRIFRIINDNRAKEINHNYYLRNKAKVLANTRKYQCDKIDRTPKWISSKELEEIKQLYIKAKELEEETGVQYHVDHIIPLHGKLVSGLHVLDNLQLLTKEENLKKSNKYNIGEVSE